MGLQLEVGKTYVTRDGRLAEVVARNDVPRTGSIEFVGFVHIEGGLKETTTYYKNGRWSASVESRHDLIREHREPMKVWVNYWLKGAPAAFESEEAAKSIASGREENYSRIAVPFKEVV